MPSTILSALDGEQVRYSNSLATVTDNWVVVRHAGAQSQSLISIASISSFRLCKTIHLTSLTCAAGCLLTAAAAQCSKDSSGTAGPFALAGLALVAGAQLSRRAAIAFLVESDVIQTGFGTLHEAATLVAAVRLAQDGGWRSKRPIYRRYSWVRVYIELLV